MKRADEEVIRALLAGPVHRFGLTEAQRDRLGELVRALAAEPDPPTAIRSPAEIATRHVADSLAALEVAQVRSAGRLVDVGAGAGFPGLPLAIALPEAAIDLLESSARKSRVIERLAARARASNARPVPVRAEEWAAGAGREAYDVVTARAVAGLAVLVEYAAPLLRPDGALIAWKGGRDEAEEKAAEAASEQLGMRLDRVLATTPFRGARDRHLHVYGKVDPTPSGYPRRPGRASKRPLG